MTYILMFTLFCFSAVSQFATAGSEQDTGMRSLQPVHLNKSYENGFGLEELSPWPDSMQLKVVPSHRYNEWYRGEKLAAMVYEPDEGILKFIDTPYDEKVYVVHGRAILTSLDGYISEFKAGDHFVVPKGWSGTWEFKDNYREVITFEKDSYDYAMDLWFNQ